MQIQSTERRLYLGDSYICVRCAHTVFEYDLQYRYPGADHAFISLDDGWISKDNSEHEDKVIGNVAEIVCLKERFQIPLILPIWGLSFNLYRLER